jgi:alpha-mannosidase
LKIFSMETLKITGSPNVMLMNSRPAFKNKGTLLLRFREVEGVPGEVKVSSVDPAKSVKSMTEVNAAGIKIGTPITSVKLKPFEVRFVEVEF